MLGRLVKLSEMKQKKFDEDFHNKRRAFVIIRDNVLITSEIGSVKSHKELLEDCFISSEKVSEIIETHPRGFYLNNEIRFYQGSSMEEGSCWRLEEKNYDIVRKVFPDLKKMFSLNKETKIFLGQRVLKGSEMWPGIAPVDLTFFGKSN